MTIRCLFAMNTSLPAHYFVQFHLEEGGASGSCKPPERKKEEKEKAPGRRERKEAVEKLNIANLQELLDLTEKIAPIDDSHYVYEVTRGTQTIKVRRYSGEGHETAITITDKAKKEEWNIYFDLGGYMEGEEKKIAIVQNRTEFPQESNITVELTKRNARDEYENVTAAQVIAKVKPIIEKEAKYPHQMRVKNTLDIVKNGGLKVRSMRVPTEVYVFEKIPVGATVNILHTVDYPEDGYPNVGIQWALVHFKRGEAVVTGWIAIKNKKGDVFLEEVKQGK